MKITFYLQKLHFSNRDINFIYGYAEYCEYYSKKYYEVIYSLPFCEFSFVINTIACIEIYLM